MKKFVRRMITLFPFEAELYRREGIDAVCAGHPLADAVEERLRNGSDAPARTARKRVVLMPGSRAGEVRRHWPVFREAARLLARGREIETFVVAAPGLSRSLFGGLEAGEMTFFEGTLEKLLASCDVLLVASGTSTLEGALCGAPMVVVYKTSPLTFALARRLVKIPDVALANIVAGERVVPELLQEEATPARLAAEAARFLDDDALSESVRRRWKPIWEKLGPRHAAAKASEAVLEALAR
jgi:lipid-A-disaccharide synthase